MFKAIDNRDGSEIIILAERWAGQIKMLRALDRTDVLVCQGCKHPVRVKAGEKRRWHFAHKHLANCRYGQESPELQNARAVLYRRLFAEFGDAVTLEKQFEGMKLPRAIDCWVDAGSNRLAYAIIDTRLLPEARAELAAGFKKLRAKVTYVFTASMLRLDEERADMLHLTTTERELMQKTWFDMELRRSRFIEGASLHYLDPESETLVTFRNLHLVHEPQLYRGRKQSTRLSDIQVSRKTGEFAHPGERERVMRFRQEKARLEREEKERRERLRQELLERERQAQVRLERERKERQERLRQEQLERERQERIRLERMAKEQAERPQAQSDLARQRGVKARKTIVQAISQEPRKPPRGIVFGLVEQEATCVFCGRTTTDWWTRQGNTCKCKDCYRKGLY